MKNLYELIDTRIKNIKDTQNNCEKSFIDYFTDVIAPFIIEKSIANINLSNFESYNNLDLIKVQEKIDVINRENFELGYEKDILIINNKYTDYYLKVINNFLECHNLGKIQKIKNYPVVYIIIDCTLKELLETYQNLNNSDYYQNLIHLTINTLDNLYSEKLCTEMFYQEFMQRLSLIIKDSINKINVLNYENFNIKDELIDRYFYLKIKNSSSKNGTGLDIYFNKDILLDYEEIKIMSKIVKEFLTEYNLGVLTLDKDLRVNINTTLDNLINAYYMEMQRLEYLSNDKPKVLTKK